MKNKLYLITGKKRAGKDTTADIIGCKKISLAEPIKQIYEIIFHEKLTDENKSNDSMYGFNRREWMQWFGTEVMQYGMIKNFKKYNLERGVWVENAMNRMSKYTRQNMVITDCRFPHEIALLKDWAEYMSYDCIVIRINRNIENNNDTHVSETELENIVPDIIIDNNGTIDDLKNHLLSLGFI